MSTKYPEIIESTVLTDVFVTHARARRLGPYTRILFGVVTPEGRHVEAATRLVIPTSEIPALIAALRAAMSAPTLSISGEPTAEHADADATAH